MDRKTCNKCWITKPISEFYKGRGKCKACLLENMAVYYKENRDWLSNNKKERYKNNKNTINAKRRENYKNNRDVYLERANVYYAKNKEEVLARAKINANRRKEEDFITFKLRNIFRWMKSRCNYKKNKCYSYYWWRWIKCLRETFDDFYKDMAPSYIEHYEKFWEKDTQIDRINNDGDYCKENCRRVTCKENNPVNHAKEFNS